MRKLIKRLFGRKQKEVFEKKKWKTIEGHDIYYFENFDAMPKYREMMIRLAYHQLELGIKITDLEAFLEVCKEAVNKGDLTQVGTCLGYLDMQLKNYASERIIMQIAGCGILVDDEPMEAPRLQDNEVKERLLKLKEVQAFF